MNQLTRSLLVVAVTFAAVAAQAVCPAGTQSRGMVDGKERCALRGKYLSAQMTLTSQNEYLIEDGVFIGGDNKENSVLRIQAGTVLRGLPGSFISVMRSSQIFAEGTKERPIVFTSLKTQDRKRGEWGGLVINGNAPINACKAGAPVCEAISEGIKIEPVKFGGNNPEDNSGVLRYVRVEFAGYPISQDNELNGITFNGVGRGTEVDYVQVHMNADDGVEFFGGTVGVKHLVLTGNEDDSIDWDFGFTGKIQFAVVQQADDSADNGVEADNLKSPQSAQPRSNPEISNVTFLGGAKSGFGLLLRAGTAAQMSNIIVTGFSKACIDIDDAETFAHNGVKIENSIISCKKNFEVEAGDPWSVQNVFSLGNLLVSPELDGWMPRENSPALGQGVTPDDLFFDPVDYIGAMGRDEDWTAGWTIRSLN